MTKKTIFFFLILLFHLVSGHSQYRRGYLFMGKVQMQRGNFTEAIQYFNSSINGLPNYFEGYYLRGLAKYNLDDLVGAENDFTQAINRLPEFPRLYMVRGVARAEQLKLDKAIKDFNHAIQLDSSYTDAYFYRSIAYTQLYKYEKALADCKTVINHNPEYKSIYVMEGLVHFYMGQYEEAIANYTKSIRLDSANYRTFVERGRVYTEMMEIERAMQDFEYVLSSDSSNAYAYFNRALAQMKLLKYDSALKDLNRVIEISPDNELAYFNRALLKRSENQEGEALNDLYHVLRQNPDNMLVYYNLGVTLHKLGHYKKAIKSFNAAIELFPDYADAYQKRALSRKELGDQKGAQQDFDTYRMLEQKNEAKSDTLKYRQGMDIMRMTQLGSDFTTREERKNKVQYQDTEIAMTPVFQLSADQVATRKVNRYYQTGNLYFNFVNKPIISNNSPVQQDSVWQEIQRLDTSLENNPNKAELYVQRGLLYNSMNAFQDAIENFDTAISLRSGYALAYFCRGNAGVGLINNKLSGQETEYMGSTTNNAALIRKYSDVIYDFKQALKHDPNLIYARFNLGYANYLMEDYHSAIDAFAEVASNQNVPEAYFNKGIILLYLKRKDEACETLGYAGQAGYDKAYSIIRKFCH